MGEPAPEEEAVDAPGRPPPISLRKPPVEAAGLGDPSLHRAAEVVASCSPRISAIGPQ